MKNSNIPSTEEEMEVIGIALEKAGKHKMEVEMLCWAFKALKEDPSITVEEALVAGLCEWDLL